MISFSGYKRWVTCPRMYYYHDIEKDRPGKKSSALVFGSLMDGVINDILLGKCTDPRSRISLEVAKVINEDMDFFPDDFDADLVDLPRLADLARVEGWKGKDIAEAVKSFLKSQDTLSSKQRMIMNQACWESLSVKADLMVDSFIQWVLPKIDQVIQVQQHLKDEQLGVHGYLDFIARLKDGRTVLFDVKTSKMPYAPTAVKESAQLALYCHMAGVDIGGFIVLTKTINKNKVKTCKPCGVKIEGGNSKKCPNCKSELQVKQQPSSYCQILIDKMPEQNKALTTGAISDTIKAIKANHFPRNVTACHNHYGKPCVYINKCWGKK